MGCVYLEGAHERLIHTHHGTSVVKLPTIVWGRKQSHQLPFSKELITILHHLKQQTIVTIHSLLAQSQYHLTVPGVPDK